MHFPTPLSVLCCHSNSIKFDFPVAISRWQVARVPNSRATKLKNLPFQDLSCVARAKLILHDDILQEFHYPVKVSYVLQMNLVCFLCNVDEMDFNHTVYAIEKDQPRSFDPVNSTSPCL
ncbi:hypothetical protein V6N13_059587 [Hibiscus sabdariffa]